MAYGPDGNLYGNVLGTLESSCSMVQMEFLLNTYTPSVAGYGAVGAWPLLFPSQRP